VHPPPLLRPRRATLRAPVARMIACASVARSTPSTQRHVPDAIELQLLGGRVAKGDVPHLVRLSNLFQHHLRPKPHLPAFALYRTPHGPQLSWAHLSLGGLQDPLLVLTPSARVVDEDSMALRSRSGEIAHGTSFLDPRRW